MARSLTTRSTNPKIMDDNIKILDDNLGKASAPDAEDVVYDNTDSGLAADDVQSAIDEIHNLTDATYELNLLNGWSGQVFVTVNRYGRVAGLSGSLLTTETTSSGVFARADTQPGSCIENRSVPVATQGGSIYNSVGGADSISFGQDSDGWYATLGSYDHNIVLNTIYGRA